MIDLSLREVKVAKPHRCIWCGNTIFKGMKAKYRVLIFKDKFQYDYSHLECYDAITRSVDEDGFVPYVNKRGKDLED